MAVRRKIVIAEDHTLLREGLKTLLSSDPALEVVGEAEDGEEAIWIVEESKPALILMDLTMPKMNGIESIKEIKKRAPGTKILVLTVHKTDEYITAALQAGADGYVLKDSSSVDLKSAIQNALKGEFAASPGVSMVVDAYRERKGRQKGSTRWEMLTGRQKTILKLLAIGNKNKDIAEALRISKKTVEKHRANIMEKLNLHSVAALTALAIEKGLNNK